MIKIISGIIVFGVFMVVFIIRWVSGIIVIIKIIKGSDWMILIMGLRIL